MPSGQPVHDQGTYCFVGGPPRREALVFARTASAIAARSHLLQGLRCWLFL